MGRSPLRTFPHGFGGFAAGTVALLPMLPLPDWAKLGRDNRNRSREEEP